MDICPGDSRVPSYATARVCQNGPDSCSRGGDDDSICCEGDRQRDWRTRSTDTAFSVHSEYISRPIASTLARQLSRLEMGCTNRLHHARVIVKSGNEREEVKTAKRSRNKKPGRRRGSARRHITCEMCLTGTLTSFRSFSTVFGSYSRVPGRRHDEVAKQTTKHVVQIEEPGYISAADVSKCEMQTARRVYKRLMDQPSGTTCIGSSLRLVTRLAWASAHRGKWGQLTDPWKN